MTAPPRWITLRCPAKLNLSLAIDPPVPTPRGPMHPLASWMATLTFSDRLELRRFDEPTSPPATLPPLSTSVSTEAETTDGLGPSLRLQRVLAHDAPRPFVIDWPAERDLACRAHALVESHVGRRLPVEARLEKRIPPGAGLGGGSANAAAMICGLSQLFDLELDAAAQIGLAQMLGSDVVFALRTLPGADRSDEALFSAAWVTGFGQDLQPLSSPGDRPVVLILPNFGCPTAQVYRRFDELLPRVDDDPVPIDRLHQAAQRGNLRPADLVNQLEPAACGVQPRLADLLRQLRQTTTLPVHLTGSGAACFVLLPTPAEAQGLADQLRYAVDGAVLITTFR